MEVVVIVAVAIVALAAYLYLWSGIPYECPRCRRKYDRRTSACPYCGEPKRYMPGF